MMTADVSLNELWLLAGAKNVETSNTRLLLYNRETEMTGAPPPSHERIVTLQRIVSQPEKYVLSNASLHINPAASQLWDRYDISVQGDVFLAHREEQKVNVRVSPIVSDVYVDSRLVATARFVDVNKVQLFRSVRNESIFRFSGLREKLADKCPWFDHYKRPSEQYDNITRLGCPAFVELKRMGLQLSEFDFNNIFHITLYIHWLDQMTELHPFSSWPVWRRVALRTLYRFVDTALLAIDSQQERWQIILSIALFKHWVVLLPRLLQWQTTIPYDKKLAGYETKWNLTTAIENAFHIRQVTLPMDIVTKDYVDGEWIGVHVTTGLELSHMRLSVQQNSPYRIVLHYHSVQTDTEFTVVADTSMEDVFLHQDEDSVASMRRVVQKYNFEAGFNEPRWREEQDAPLDTRILAIFELNRERDEEGVLRFPFPVDEMFPLTPYWQFTHAGAYFLLQTTMMDLLTEYSGIRPNLPSLPPPIHSQLTTYIIPNVEYAPAAGKIKK